jgi:hypothetical protein
VSGLADFGVTVFGGRTHTATIPQEDDGAHKPVQFALKQLAGTLAAGFLYFLDLDRFWLR